MAAYSAEPPIHTSTRFSDSAKNLWGTVESKTKSKVNPPTARARYNYMFHVHVTCNVNVSAYYMCI